MGARENGLLACVRETREGPAVIILHHKILRFSWIKYLSERSVGGLLFVFDLNLRKRDIHMLWRKYHSFNVNPDVGRRFFSGTPRSQSNHKLSCFSLFYFFILHLLVKNRYEIVHISHEINNNKKSYLTSFFLSKQSLLHWKEKHKTNASVVTFLRIESPSCIGPGRPAIVWESLQTRTKYFCNIIFR